MKKTSLEECLKILDAQKPNTRWIQVLDKTNSRVKLQCICGNTKEVETYRFTSGVSRGCGCYQGKVEKHGDASTRFIEE
jgi:hypothetical protein